MSSHSATSRRGVRNTRALAFGLASLVLLGTAQLGQATSGFAAVDPVESEEVVLDASTEELLPTDDSVLEEESAHAEAEQPSDDPAVEGEDFEDVTLTESDEVDGDEALEVQSRPDITPMAVENFCQPGEYFIQVRSSSSMHIRRATYSGNTVDASTERIPLGTRTSPSHTTVTPTL